MHRKICIALPALFIAGFLFARSRPAQCTQDGFTCDTRELLEVEKCAETDDDAKFAAQAALYLSCEGWPAAGGYEVGCCSATCWPVEGAGEYSCYACSGFPKKQVIDEAPFPTQPEWSPLPEPIRRGRNPVGG